MRNVNAKESTALVVMGSIRVLQTMPKNIL